MAREMDEAAWAAKQARVQALLARPSVAAVIERAGRLTDDEKARLHAAWRPHYRLYRTAQSDLSHRTHKAYGEHWRDILAVKEHARLTERAGLDPYEGPWWGASCAVEDAAAAALLADLLSPHEVPVLAGPWQAVIGADVVEAPRRNGFYDQGGRWIPQGMPAALEEPGEQFVLPLADAARGE